MITALALTHNAQEVHMPYLLHLDLDGLIALHRMAGITLSLIEAGQELDEQPLTGDIDPIIDEIQARAESDELRAAAVYIQQLTQPYLPQ